MMDMSVDEDFGSDFIASARAAINGITRGSAEYSSSPDRSNLPIVKIYQWKVGFRSAEYRDIALDNRLTTPPFLFWKEL